MLKSQENQKCLEKGEIAAGYHRKQQYAQARAYWKEAYEKSKCTKNSDYILSRIDQCNKILDWDWKPMKVVLKLVR